MSLHPQVAGFLQQLASMGAKPFHTMGPVEARQAFSALSASLPRSAAKIASSVDRTVPGPAGDIPVRVYTPEGNGPFPALVYFHGGGFVFGQLDDYDQICRELSGNVGCVVVSVDYRLAPEHKFPAAPEDCFAATKWVAANAASIGADADRIAVGGDSAGGGLAAVVAQLARDAKGPKLAAQLLVYPVTQAGEPTQSMIDNADGYLLTKADMEYFFNHYVRSADDAKDPRIAPMLTRDLSGLPPAWVVTCEFDPLRDEGEAYAAALAKAGVPVAATRIDGTIHASWNFFGVLEPGRRMMDEGIRWLREQFRKN